MIAELVAAFAARLKDAVELDTVRADLAGVVQAALEPAHVWVWTSRPSAPGSRRVMPDAISSCGIADSAIEWADIITQGLDRGEQP